MKNNNTLLLKHKVGTGRLILFIFISNILSNALPLNY